MVAILSKFTVLCLSSYFVVYFSKLELIFFCNKVVYYHSRIFLIFLPHPIYIAPIYEYPLTSFLLDQRYYFQRNVIQSIRILLAIIITKLYSI